MVATQGRERLMRNGRGPNGARKQWWLLFLLPPFLFLLWPAYYSTVSPTFLGFPFFYWYQFLWVLIAAALTYVTYLRLRQP
jgi:hypothetical protein